MSKRFGKIEIVKKISDKTNNAIAFRLLNDIVDIISDFIFDEIALNKTFSVNKFGTFYQATRKPRLIWSNAQQKKVMSRPGIGIKFAPHVTFSKLLKEKQKIILEAYQTEKLNSK